MALRMRHHSEAHNSKFRTCSVDVERIRYLHIISVLGQTEENIVGSYRVKINKLYYEINK